MRHRIAILSFFSKLSGLTLTTLTLTTLTLTTLTLCSVSFAEELYVVHGIDGRDLAIAQSAAVDVSVNGNCLLKGATFRQVAGPVVVTPGAYEAQVRLANGNCSGAIVATKRVDVALNESVSVVAHLNEEGAPTLTKFTTDQRSTEGTKGRIILRHVAGLEPVSVRVRRFVSSDSRLTFGSVIPVFKNGEQRSYEVVGGGKYLLWINNSIGSRKRLATADVQVAEDGLSIVYVVGTVKGNTLSVINQSGLTVR